MNARLLKRTFCLCLVLVVTTTGCFSAFDRFRRSDNWESVTFLSDEVKELVFAKDVALMTTNQGFFYSTDFTHFKRSGVMLPRGSSVVSFGMADNINDIYAVTEKGYLLRSTDRGASYKMIGEFPSIQIYDVALTTDELLFVATSSGLLVADLDLSKVSDKNERKHFMPWEMLVMALPIWRRANLGSDSDPWHDWSVVLPGNSHRIASDPRDPNHLYAEVLDEGIYESRDAGASWEPLTSDGERVKGPITFGPDKNVMIGKFLSKDGGINFFSTRLTPDRNDEEQIDEFTFPVHSNAINHEGLWALHRKAASVYFSRTGYSWKRVGKPIDFFARRNEESPSVLAVDKQGNLWVATDGHGLFRYTSENVDK